MDRQAYRLASSPGPSGSKVSSRQPGLNARRAAAGIAAFFRGGDSKRNDKDDDDDLPRPNATISGLFPMRFVRPALA